jgi:hypothetical protein
MEKGERTVKWLSSEDICMDKIGELAGIESQFSDDYRCIRN